MDIPSLFMIPSAVSSGKVHSVFPNSTDADFDFNRDSSATRVNSQGLIETVGYFSNEKVTSLENSGFYPFNTFTDNGGGSYTCVSTNTSWAGFQQPSSETFAVTSGQVYRITFDIVKHSGTSFQFFIGNNAVGTAYTPVTAISASGSYSFDHTVTTTNSAARLVSQCNQIINFTISNISIKEIQGDRARLNYEIEGGLVNTKPSLLLEPQSTNEVTYSEKFNQWSNVGGVTFTSDIAKSPDGSMSADGIQDTTGGSFKRLRIVKSSISPNSTFTASVFVKKETSQINFGGIALVYQNVSTATSYGIIDAVNGTIVNGSGSITPTFNVVDFGNYWRFEMTSTDNGSNTAVEFAIYGTLSNNGTSLGVGAGSVRTIWGAQLEQQSYATSYIPTNGSTQTRAAETCNGAGTSSILPSEEGILYTEIAALSTTDPTHQNRDISISDGTINNTLILYYQSSLNRISVYINVGNVMVALGSVTSYTVTNFNKIAVRWKQNDFRMYINGTLVFSDTSGASFSSGTLNRINFDNAIGNDDFYGKIRDIRVYNTKEMTDSEVDILLTKITS